MTKPSDCIWTLPGGKNMLLGVYVFTAESCSRTGHSAAELGSILQTSAATRDERSMHDRWSRHSFCRRL
eukprot:3829577-Rhodomonas_salina.2